MMKKTRNQMPGHTKEKIKNINRSVMGTHYCLLSFLIFIFIYLFGCASSIEPIHRTDILKPVWIESARNPAFPDSLFMLGVGIEKVTGNPADDRKKADANAFGEIAKQIRSRIKTMDIHISSERAVSGKSFDQITTDSSLSISEIYSDLVIQGLSFAERYTDRENGITYSLAVIDRRQAAETLKNEIEQLRAYYSECLTAGERLTSQFRHLRALWFLKEAAITLKFMEERISVAEYVLSMIHTDKSAWLRPMASSFQPLEKAEEILERLTLEKISGDHQKASLGMSPGKFLVVNYFSSRNETSTPIEGALIRFCFQKGNGSLTDSAFTDRRGVASCKIYKLEPSELDSYEISATFDYSSIFQNGQVLPEAWNELVRTYEKKVIFRINIETEEIESKVRFLAMKLAEGLPKDQRVPLRLVMGNLTYQDFRISSPFLSYFQDQITSELIRHPQFQVLKETELQKTIQTRSIAVTQKEIPSTPSGILNITNADGVIMGKCWEKGDSLLSIIVDIIQSDSKTALTSSSISIRKDRIPSNLSLLPVNFNEIKQYSDIWNDVSSPESRLEVKLWVDRLDGGVYQEGEKMQPYVWANKQCFLNLIYHDAAGNDLLIFPNAYRSDNRILGNTVYEIPSVLDRFDFTVVRPCGVEILKAFASTHPLPHLEGNESGGGIKLLKIPLKRLAETLRSVEVIKRGDVPMPEAGSSTKLFERAEASCVVTTVEKN